jgi:hypothetical protein
MAFGSYCWSANGKAACVDMIPPTARRDIPRLRVGRGATISVHVRFNPTRVEATVAGHALRPAVRGATVTWRARSSGLVILGTKSSGGGASYLIRVNIRV